MELTKEECENLLDALKEWDDTCGPKELNDEEVGLSSYRYDKLTSLLRTEVNKLENEKVRDKERTAVLMVGNLNEGWKAIGPFETFDDASEYSETWAHMLSPLSPSLFSFTDHWVMTLESPEKSIEQPKESEEHKHD